MEKSSPWGSTLRRGRFHSRSPRAARGAPWREWWRRPPRSALSICPAGNSQMAARMGMRSCRMSKSRPSDVNGAMTTAPLRCTTVHFMPFGREGVRISAMKTCTFGFPYIKIAMHGLPSIPVADEEVKIGSGFGHDLILQSQCSWLSTLCQRSNCALTFAREGAPTACRASMARRRSRASNTSAANTGENP